MESLESGHSPRLPPTAPLKAIQSFCLPLSCPMGLASWQGATRPWHMGLRAAERQMARDRGRNANAQIEEHICCWPCSGGSCNQEAGTSGGLPGPWSPSCQMGLPSSEGEFSPLPTGTRILSQGLSFWTSLWRRETPWRESSGPPV